jgi:periplasmic protein TonB
MEANKILNADILDIIFEGRNKEYGAYQLRKTYNKRIITALAATAAVLLLLFFGSVLANVLGKKKDGNLEVEREVQLEEVKQPEKKPDIPPPPPPPQPAPPPKVEIAKFTPPKIVKDEEVKEDEKPPEQEKLETAQIGTINQEGVKDEGIVAPPTESGTGTAVVAPKVETEDYDKVFTKVEVAASFPGGLDGWRRYLERNLQYPESAQENGTQGVVRVQMVVDKDGNITEVQALNNPGDGLAEEAMRVIKKGPKWVPAEQNGRKVTYRFVQNVTFQLQ